MAQPDIIVIGGGFAGLSAAWHLSFTHRVLVLEQNDRPGLEASAQNAGMVRLLDEDPVDRSLALRTEQFFSSPPDTWLGANPTRQTGAILSLAHDTHALHDSAAWLRAAGIPIQPVDRPEDVAPAMAGNRAAFHWYLPSARTADPSALIQGYIDGIRERSGRIRVNTRVQALLNQSGRVIGVETIEGAIHAEHVIIATGAWGPQLSREWVAPLHAIRRTIFRTSPHPLASNDHPWCWIHDIGCYIRPDTGAWMCSPCDEVLEKRPISVPSTGDPSDDHGDLMRQKIMQWFPALSTASIASGWTGLRTFASDRRPILGRDPTTRGLWWACGLGGFGLTTSFAVGEAIGHWLRGDPTPWLEADAMSPARAYPTRWVIFPSGEHNHSVLIPG